MFIPREYRCDFDFLKAAKDLKIALLAREGGIGRTCLMNEICHSVHRRSDFDEDWKRSIQINTHTITATLLKFCCQEEYMSMLDIWVRGVDHVIICDLCDSPGFLDFVEEMVYKCRRVNDLFEEDRLSFSMVRLRADENRRVVDRQKIMAYAWKNDAAFISCSTQLDLNCQLIFETSVKSALAARQESFLQNEKRKRNKTKKKK